MKTVARSLFAMLLALARPAWSAGEEPPTVAAALQQADRLFKDQHWAEAAARYDAARVHLADWNAPEMRRAIEGTAACAAKLTRWDDALNVLEAYIAHNPGTLSEVAGQRLLAGLYLNCPHYGIVQGGRFLRGRSGQGTDKDVEESDHREAITRLEHAREVAARLAAALPPGSPEEGRQEIERAWIGTDFDLTSALTRTYASGNQHLDAWLGVRPPKDGSAENPDGNQNPVPVDDDNPHAPPHGLPPQSDGTPTFAKLPAAYDPKLAPAEKFLFLLTEVERLDTSAHRDAAANALLRRAALAQLLYGPDNAEAWVRWWREEHSDGFRNNAYGAGQGPPPPVPATKTWQLRDDQALVPVGSWLKVIDLPADESPLALLAAAETRYPQSTLRPEIGYERALYLQDREQYPQAVAQYRAVAEQFPADPRASDARGQIREIETPGVSLGGTETFLPGERPRLTFTARNAGTVEFTAIRFDLIRYAEGVASFDGFDRDSGHSIFTSESWRKYLQKETVHWSEAAPAGQENRPVEGATLAPLAEPGAYIVEAQVAGNKAPARALVLVTDILLMCKSVRDGDGYASLLVTCDARTGQPLPERALRIYEQWKEPDRPGRKGAEHVDRQTLITSADGSAVYRRRHKDELVGIDAATVGPGGRIAFTGLRTAHDDHADDGPPGQAGVGYLITDRPVYRPGATVHYCVWLREKRDGVYRLPPPGPVPVRITDARFRPVQATVAQIDEAGVLSGEYVLNADAALGSYRVAVGKEVAPGEAPEWWINDDSFRVEEYRQPEFEVNVHPSTAQARLGDRFKATIEARYYFGAPVTQARVSYKVYREVFVRSYFEPGEYDAIYGRGYGLLWYPYPWLSWWERWGGEIGWGPGRLDPVPAPDWSDERHDPRELVAQGETTLDAGGRCEVEVDTARAKAERGGHDHQYTIATTVIGANRRAVEGTGSVVATRQAFYAFVEADHGWYTAGEEARLRVRTLTPGNLPVTVQGEVVVSRVHYDGPDHDLVTEEEVQRWSAGTDADGRLAAKAALPTEGQYHVAFRARDAWEQEVQGNAVFWVQGPRFDGRAYRSNELELITDRRSYRVGETAHLLINTAGDGARVLFARREPGGGLTHARFVDVPRRSLVIDVPIDESCVPNAEFEATAVHDGRVYTESCELVVPAAQKLLNLSLRTDKETYRPGEKGKVHVEATDQAGRPATGQVTLTAFDKAVTYIQAESVVGPDTVFYAADYISGAEVDSSFNQGFEAEEASNEPRMTSSGAPVPEGWERPWTIGAGMPDTPLLRLLRAGLEGYADADRVIVTGSNIPTAVETGPTTLLADPVAGKPPGVSTSFARTRGSPPAKLADPEIRTHFADTALWLPALKLDADGKTDAEIEFPQSLTTWRLHGYAVNAATQVGDATAQAVTTKKLLVRLLSPRFFTERDEVVLSAAANNSLPDAQDVRAELIVPAALFGPADGAPSAPDADGNLHLTATANVASNSEHRFDWPIKVLAPGMATITARARTPQESDGVRLTFPVEVHGLAKTLAQSGSFRVGQEGRTLHFDVPAEVDAAQTRLEIDLSPSLAGVMIDALPYLADYPYGCVEQTLDRFYPSVLVRNTLKRMGTDLEALGNQRRQMNPADLAHRFGHSPVYDSERLDRMIREGLTAVYDAQDLDGGGWGWWAGEAPSLFQTAYVLQGLQAAGAAGVNVDQTVYDNGYHYLWRTVSTELAKPVNRQELGNVQQQAYYAYILSLEALPEVPVSASGSARDRKENVRSKWLDRLYAGRGELNNQGRALLALALHHAGREEQARTTLRNVLQYVERDDSNETARVRTPATGWWFWWNSDIETNAWTLKALVAIDPKNDLAPRLVKWLLNNRRGGSYWRGTRDTAQVISAMTDYLLASGEGTPDCRLSVRVDGEEARDVHLTRENLFTFDNKVVLTGAALKPGPHEVTFHKQGAGALYYSCRLTYFTHEEGVKAAGDEIGVERQYFKLVPKDGVAEPTPVPLKDGDELASGDLVEVALKITAKNTCDSLAFEDPKPAGCEPVEVRSGGQWQEGFCADVELRDTKTVFFVETLEQGEHFLRYRLRAETPGRFHVLPTTGTAIYAPELHANSDELHLGVRD